jgi:succinate dehydrogenase / fumarate reductase flavoprotein subunit
MQGVPLAREYGGLLDNRSLEDFGSKNFYAKGQTGQQLLLGAYSAMNRQIGRGKIKSYPSRNARFGSDWVKREELLLVI